MSPRFPATRLQRELDEQLVESAEKGNASNVLLFLERGANPIANNSLPLYWASENGHAECVRLLAPLSDPQARNSRSLARAAYNGHVECVRILIPFSDPQADNSGALGNAALNGHIECVKLLAPVSDPEAAESSALCQASANGHVECVKLLLSASNPCVDTSRALSWASLHGHVECVKALLPTSQPTSRGWATGLSNVVKGGHAECFRLLLSASGTLADPKNIFAQALCSGHAEIMAILLEHEPRLPGDIDLALSRQQAQRQGFHEIATLCLALMDRCELSVSARLPAASPMPDATPTCPKVSSKPAPRL